MPVANYLMYTLNHALASFRVRSTCSRSIAMLSTIGPVYVMLDVDDSIIIIQIYIYRLLYGMWYEKCHIITYKCIIYFNSSFLIFVRDDRFQKP
jgi:hypothetical protein